MTASPGDAAVRALLTPEAVRERCNELWGLAQDDALEGFVLDTAGLDRAAERTVAEIRANYAHRPVPLHSRWRHFELAGHDLWHELAMENPPLDAHALARSRFDLAIVSVLLDAGAGDRWRYLDRPTGLTRGRSEGLALASLRLFASGELSDAGRRDPLRADAKALAALDPSRLARALQVREDNPLPGLEQRCELLRGLGAALLSTPGVFEQHGGFRAGHLYDYLRSRAESGQIAAREILLSLLEHLGAIWPHGRLLAGTRVGDVGRHPAIRREDASDGLVPFHKLSQWLAYSLIEPLQESGIEVTGLDGLTGLAEYRNGGLLIDCGALTLRDAGASTTAHAADSVLVVEWRALTVAALDRIAERVRGRLGLERSSLPLAAVLQGGTWSAGRRIAAERRVEGGPPLAVTSDGTLF